MSKGITKVLISLFAALLCVMPFSLKTYADGAVADDPGFIAAVEFFEPYNLRERKSKYSLSCVSGSTSTGYCPLYTFTETSPNNNEVYFRMQVPDGESFKSPTGYDTSNRFRTTKEPLYLVFLSNRNYTTSNVSVYPQSGYIVDWTRVTNDTQTVMTPNGFYLITLRFTASTYPSSGTVWATLDLEGDISTSIVPLYKGPEIAMTDNLHRVVFGTGQTYNVSDPDVVNAISNQTLSLAGQLISINGNQQSIIDQLTNIRNGARDTAANTLNIYNLLLQGNNNTSSSVTSNDQQNSDLSTSIDSLVDQEDDFNNDMQQNLNNINFQGSDQFLQTGMLSTSAHWVKTQYNRMVSGNVIGSLVSYALLFGLGILIVGKMR